MEQQRRGVCSFTPDRCSGCGAGVAICQPTMRLSITSTTGSPIELTVPRGDTVEELRTRLAQKLGLQTDKIVLLHNERKLTSGKLLDFGLVDGSKVTLVPVIEAGLVCSTNTPERTVMDILESLTEVQISDFLSGCSPLTINLRIGAHVMHVQLQLSAHDVKELQQDGDVRVKGSSEHKPNLPKAVSVTHPDPGSTWSSSNTTGSTTSLYPNTSTPDLKTGDSASSVQLSKPFKSTDPTFHSSSTVPAVNCHQSSPHHSHPLCAILSPPPLTSSLPSGCPHPSCLLQAATPVCSPAPTGYSSGPPSPTPASPVTKSNIEVPPTTELCKQPGAVIESFVSHSQGVFSGTFSGTLAHYSQPGHCHPRRGISVILQILNDLLKAAYNHQGASPTLPKCHSPTLNLPVSPGLIAEGTSRPRGNPLVTQQPEHLGKASGEESHPLHSSTEENKTLHCKLEHLQFLMHQRRLHRRTRRSSHLSQTSHPYQDHRHCP